MRSPPASSAPPARWTSPPWRVYSDADRDAPYVAAADESVHLPGTAPADTYLRGDLVLAAAARTGADAIHPGYGFLSENADFAATCADAGVVFVGPSPAAITAMGSKIAAKELMAAAGVPVLPGATVPSGADLDPERLSKEAATIGYPILVKAAFGGGGRGMRIVADADGLLEAVHSARREAASAFGDGTVFLEKFVESPRHIEVQIFGDSLGTVVHLGERECSIQRRYQKIIEEAPSTAVDAALREKLGRAAVAAGQALAYEGAGTVEFVMAPDGSFYFLEVNTRLQVEHPVTELVTGIDLVRAQLLVAAGEPLPREMLERLPAGSRDRGAAVRGRCCGRLHSGGRQADDAGVPESERYPGRRRLRVRIGDQHLLRSHAGQGDRIRPRPRRGVRAGGTAL